MSGIMTMEVARGQAYREWTRGLRVTVVGLARSGVAACRLLREIGASVIATDMKPKGELSPEARDLERSGVDLWVGDHPAIAFHDRDLIVLSPGVMSDLPVLQRARERGVPVIGEMELGWRAMEAPVIAVTGTNGKTTTTALVGALLGAGTRPVFVGGNIGRPLSADALAIPPDALSVLEVSSFQLETIELFHPEVAVCLNLTPDHLDRYASFERYRDAKARIFENQTAHDWAVLNADDPEVSWFSKTTKARKIFFSVHRELVEGVFLQDGWIMARHDGRELVIGPVKEVPLLGRHNLENVLAASACALWAGLPLPDIRRAIAGFKGVPHRLEWVRELEGVGYYNDSKATNVASAQKALEAFQKPIILIAGGLGKGQDFSPLGATAWGKVRLAVLIGKDRAALGAALHDATEVEECGSLEEAVSMARRVAKPGQVVLLSPACASFDMFRDYEDRGEKFKALVLSLQPRLDTYA